MRAAKVTVFSSMPQRYINPMLMAVQTGRPELAMSAVRKGKSSSMTTMTTIIEMSKSRRKLLTDFCTTLGWSVMRYIFTLSGSDCLNSDSTFSTSRPKATML